jgi:hypothetical protein
MKNSILCLAPLLLASSGVLYPGFSPSTPKPETNVETKAEREQNTPPDLVDQIDTTDVFAVPVDTSEEEEEVNEAQLEQMQKKMQDQKPAATRPQPTKP